MDHYHDIRLRPDPEFPPTLLMNALFAKLHRALAGNHELSIGISFPEHGTSPPNLGQRLRLHGAADALSRLADLCWQEGMADHVRQLPITPVPAAAAHCTVRRVQAKSSPARLRRRRMRRHGIGAESAVAAIPDQAVEHLNLPYLQLRSSSTGEHFRLYLRHSPADRPMAGTFNAYGLSRDGTLPWF
jgi:CRISPR-associated endonuclease Csy4